MCSSALIVNCMGSFLSVRPGDHWQRELAVRFYCRWYDIIRSGVCVLVRIIKLAVMLVVKPYFFSWINLLWLNLQWKMHVLAIYFMQNFSFFDPQTQPEVHSGDMKRSENLFEFFMIQLWKVNSNPVTSVVNLIAISIYVDSKLH